MFLNRIKISIVFLKVIEEDYES
ncbi:hypothetical protein CY0110_18642 [Crocosphaera chwakensis CCY0110]|uniref:Uncharacterized protein n=1 Tax=Crocosphaera chwakensis CCY0110 TaxID=391612 RepID=A3IJ60_9CHRO|nr:hypothetical protein CY0110_18642 [Crocosphaera chwakensis CCY0110]